MKFNVNILDNSCSVHNLLKKNFKLKQIKNILDFKHTC